MSLVVKIATKMSYTKHFSFFSFVISIWSWFNSPFRDWIFQTCRTSFQPLLRIPHGMTQHGGETERVRALYQDKGPHGYPTVWEEFKNLLGFITPCLSRTRPWKNCIRPPSHLFKHPLPTCLSLSCHNGDKTLVHEPTEDTVTSF